MTKEMIELNIQYFKNIVNSGERILETCSFLKNQLDDAELTEGFFSDNTEKYYFKIQRGEYSKIKYYMISALDIIEIQENNYENELYNARCNELYIEDPDFKIFNDAIKELENNITTAPIIIKQLEENLKEI